MPVEDLEKALLESIAENKRKGQPIKGNPALEAARATLPPTFSVIDTPTQGKVVAGDPNLVSGIVPELKAANEIS